jgi:hypothetical protein
MTQKDDERAKKIRDLREAVKRAQKELAQEERRQKGFLQNVHEDSKSIADNLRKHSIGMAAGAIGLGNEKVLPGTAGPVLGFVGGLSAAYALAVLYVPCAVVARTTKIAAAVTGHRFK